MRGYSAAFVARDPERKRSQFRAYAARHPERRRAKDRKHHAENRPARIAKALAWNQRNRERFNQICVNAQEKRRAIKKGVTATMTLFDWETTLEVFNGRCAYCLEPCKAEQEHFRPLSRGGTHDVDNVVPACEACNRRKHAGLIFDFLPRGIGATAAAA